MPKKTKKGGGGGGGGKTEEEKLLYLQQRAQAEEEMTRKREETLTLFLKDKLQKEERSTSVNLLKLNDGWRSILRQTRAVELRHDITVLSQTFERHLEALDSVIKNLEGDLQEGERQSAQVRRLHLQRVERLWALQEQRLLLVQQRCERSVQQLSCSFNAERQQMLSDCEQQRADLDNSMFTVEQQHQAAMEELCRLYSETIVAHQSAHEDRVAYIMAYKRAHTDEMLQSHEAAEVNRKMLQRLLSCNTAVIQETNLRGEKLKKNQDKVTKMRAMLNLTETKNQSVVQDLSTARDQVNRNNHELRNQRAKAQAAARNRLTDLTVQSAAATKKLKAVIAKGERVLQVGEMCQKLESKLKNEASIGTEEHRPDGTPPEEPAQVSEFPELQQVTRRLNAAVLQREALRRRRDDLRRENQQLRRLLRQQLDGMTVSDDAFHERHALLAVSQAPTALGPPDTNRRHTVIEAAHTVKHSLYKTGGE